MVHRLHDFEPGHHVIYTPHHGSVDIERGVVVTVTDHYVFVRYGEEELAKATKAENLRHNRKGRNDGRS